ncbi:PREDICTED: methylated-DNA--protein-cysteine methyltransferase [Acromyrmex echinatior]|uniref:methylated-DNA--protein-cysteine methyltransferase n=1 Tax=Acromyrmex echinatior TaxID=103372 RepID=UPI000581069C|nr:PREDICTED: methylated-DNA--protein-cysteine methyltransferase [Acromyrmex echinatior]
MVVFRSITVDEYKSNYMTFQLLYACHRTPIGKCLIAITDTDESVTYLKFIDNEYDGEATALKDLKAKWPLTQTLKDTDNKTDAVIAKVFHPNYSQLNSIHVFMKGTKFQIKIWRSLTEIPGGTVTTYGEVARMAGCDSKTAIAVGNACSRNYVAYIVPCHRVVAKNTHVCGIKNAWKIEQKGTILEYEKQLYA